MFSDAINDLLKYLNKTFKLRYKNKKDFNTFLLVNCIRLFNKYASTSSL